MVVKTFYDAFISEISTTDYHACYLNSIIFQHKDAKQISFSDHSNHILKKEISCIQSAYYLMCKTH